MNINYIYPTGQVNYFFQNSMT